MTKSSHSLLLLEKLHGDSKLFVKIYTPGNWYFSTLLALLQYAGRRLPSKLAVEKQVENREYNIYSIYLVIYM